MVIPGAGATGSGALAGVSARESLRLIAGELGTEPHLAYLPLLPERGPGGDPVGRTAGLLTEVSSYFSLVTTPSGWRIDAGAGSREMRRARSWLGEDLDAAEEALDGYDRDLLLPVVGPWSLAASIELVTGHRLIRDHAAAGDLVLALAEALAGLVHEVRRRVPACRPVVRLDEPGLDSVLGGLVPTPSGLDRYRSVSEARATDALAAIVSAVSAAGADCAVRVARGTLPLAVMIGSGAAALCTDLASIDLRREGERLGTFIEEGRTLLLGVDAADSAATVDSVTALWTRLGFAVEVLPASIALQPSWSAEPPVDPLAEFASLREASARLREVREDAHG